MKDSGKYAEDRKRLGVGRHFPTVGKVSLEEQLAHSWQFPEVRGVPKERKWMFLERLGVGRRPTESDGGSLDLVLGRVGPVSSISSRLLTTISIGLPLVQYCFLFFQLNLAGIFQLNYKMKENNKTTLSMPGLMTPNILAAEPQSSLAAKAHGPNTSPF